MASERILVLLWESSAILEWAEYRCSWSKTRGPSRLAGFVESPPCCRQPTLPLWPSPMRAARNNNREAALWQVIASLASLSLGGGSAEATVPAGGSAAESSGPASTNDEWEEVHASSSPAPRRSPSEAAAGTPARSRDSPSEPESPRHCPEAVSPVAAGATGPASPGPAVPKAHGRAFASVQLPAMVWVTEGSLCRKEGSFHVSSSCAGLRPSRTAVQQVREQTLTARFFACRICAAGCDR